MLRPRTPLDAYRADLAGAPGVTVFGDHDGAWLLLAELLARRADALGRAQPTERIDADLQAVLAGLTPRPEASPASSPVSEESAAAAPGLDVFAVLDDVVLRVADLMEEAGALQLANTTLLLLEQALANPSDRQRGTIRVQRARVARKAGAVDTAHDLYDQAARLARRARYAPVAVRALAGQAVLARRRGNYPASRTLYRRALRLAERAGASAEAGLAHHGLLIAASVAGDVDTALVHGWAAFRLAQDAPSRQADVLGTLGAAASDAGHYRAALGAYLGAAHRSPVARVRLPAMGGAAVCAARLGDAAQLDAATRAVEADLARGALPYEHAQALMLLAEAWVHHGPPARGERYRARALEIARAHGFHELVLQAESLAPAAAAGADRAAVAGAVAGTPNASGERAVPAPTRRVLRALEGLDADDSHRLATVEH